MPTTPSNPAPLRLLDRDDVARLLTLDDALNATREAFCLHSREGGRSFPVVRERLAGDGIFGIKSGDAAERDLLGFKAAGFWPDNRRHGREAHQATVMLFDPASGRPRCLLDGNAITTLRTGAAGGLGLQHLARPDSAVLTVFGSGVQAQIQVRFALQLLPELREIRYVTRDGQAQPAFEARLADALLPRRVTLVHRTDADASVGESDVVITATPGAGPLFADAAVRPGTHLNCVGADTVGKRELPAGLLSRARLVVDDPAQARRIGETQWAPETPCLTLGDLLSGRAGFIRQADEITVFDLTGLALQDLVLAQHLQQKAEASGIGTPVVWPG